MRKSVRHRGFQLRLAVGPSRDVFWGEAWEYGLLIETDWWADAPRIALGLDTSAGKIGLHATRPGKDFIFAANWRVNNFLLVKRRYQLSLSRFSVVLSNISADNTGITLTFQPWLWEFVWLFQCYVWNKERWDDLCPSRACGDLPIAAVPRLNVADWSFHLSRLALLSGDLCVCVSLLSPFLLVTLDLAVQRGRGTALVAWL